MSTIQRTMSSESGRYVPVHRRNSSSSSSRPSSVPHPYIYTVEALLALAPPSQTHGTDSPSPSTSAPSSPKATTSKLPSEPHKGWIKANEAMRAYLRATCPEIAMNRKMRKSLEFHNIQHQRAARQQQREEERSAHQRSTSPNVHRSPLRPSSAANQTHVEEAPAFKLSPAPKRHTPSTPSTADALQRSRSPVPRRTRPNNSRTRHANFTQLHLNAAAVAASADGNWRTVTRRGVIPAVTPLPVVSVL